MSATIWRVGEAIDVLGGTSFNNDMEILPIQIMVHYVNIFEDVDRIPNFLAASI